MDSYGNKVDEPLRSEHLHPENQDLYQHPHNACPSPALTTHWSRPVSKTSIIGDSPNNKRQESVKKIKIGLLDIGSRTTVHGVANIVTSQSVYKRLLWVLAFLACFGLLIWQLVDIFVLYTSYQTTTSFGLKYNTEFPQITLCNNGYASYGAPVYNYTVENMLVSCEYARLNTGCQENLTTYWSNKYGLCFTITPPDYLAKFSGVQGAIILILNLEKHKQRSNDQHGMRITVHDKNIFPSPFDDGLTVEGGDEAFIGIKMVHTERLGGRHGDCSNNNTLQDKAYTLKACELLCWERLLLNECNCTDPEIDSHLIRIQSNIKGVDTCYGRDGELTDCFIEAKRKFMDKRGLCNNCHLPCSENRYTMTLNRHYWLRGPDVGSLADKTCKNNYNISSSACPFYFYEGENYVKMVIYLQDLTHESIVEEPLYDIPQLLADIGGSLGLFIGASVLSLGEVMEVVYVCLHGLFQRQQRET